MTILMVGGGSGGHITPLLAVTGELKKRCPDCLVIYAGERGGNLFKTILDNPDIDQILLIWAGKLRRYHGESWLSRLIDVKTLLLNARDIFYTLVGVIQSLLLLKRYKPDVIFIKGGFVGVPVGIAARWLRIPFITHDSDTVPGLANRIIGRWARWCATGMPLRFYNYPKGKARYVGIPLQTGFEVVTSELLQHYRHQIQIPKNAKLLFVIGGSLGARNINKAMISVLPNLLTQFNDLYVVQSAGPRHGQAVRSSYSRVLSPDQQSRVRVFDFIGDVYRYSGAADVVITRAGATNLAEFAIQGKACVVIPHSQLVGGHQISNAQRLNEAGAAVVINDTDVATNPSVLVETLSRLLNEPRLRGELADNIITFAKPNAASKLARLIIETAK